MHIETREEAARAMAEYGQLTWEARKLEAEEEKTLQRVHETYARRKGDGESRRQELERALENFARARKREFQPVPGGPGRAFSANGVSIGFRLTPPAVRMRDEASALAWFAGSRLDCFLRVTYTPDREALKRGLSNGNGRLIETLAAHGITLARREKFFVELLQG